MTKQQQRNKDIVQLINQTAIEAEIREIRVNNDYSVDPETVVSGGLVVEDSRRYQLSFLLHDYSESERAEETFRTHVTEHTTNYCDGLTDIDIRSLSAPRKFSVRVLVDNSDLN